MTCFSALRYRLLELALSGRLLPQQDSEPVVKPKNVSPALDEVPFALPNKWQWYQLNDLGQVFRGRTPSDKTENWDNPTIPWITGTDLHANQSKGVYIWEGACGITEQGLLETYAKLVPIGAVIYTITGFNIGDIAITARECSINNSCYAYVPDFELISSKWAYYVLKWATPKLLSKALGTTMPRIAADVFGQTWIPLPSLKEQERIITKLEHFMQQIDLLEQSYRLLEPLAQATRAKVQQLALAGQLVPQQIDEPKVEFKGTFPIKEVPFSIPDKWKWLCLGDLVDIKSGVDTKAMDQGNAKFLRIADFYDGEVNWDKVKLGQISAARLDLADLQVNDIVIAKSGSIGKAWVVDHLDPSWPCVFSGSLFRLRLKPSIPVEPNYLKLYFQSQLFERHILIWAHGSLTRNIGSDDIAELPLSLPPLGEQRRIVARVTQLMALIDQFQDAFSFSNLLAPETPPKLPEQASEPNLQVKSADIASEPEPQPAPLKPEAAAPTPEVTARKLAPDPALDPQPVSSDIASEPETQACSLKPEAAAPIPEATLRKQATDPALEPQPLSPDIEPENKSVPLKSEAAAPTPEATTRKQAAEPALESQPLSSDIEPEPETQPAPLKSEAAESTEVPPCKQTQPKSKPRHNKARPATQLNLLDQIEALNDWS